ncbi:MAG: beta-ketoacyl-ACP synthase III [Hyphomonadaceae bacterium]
MRTVVISGTGLYTPPESISNEELVASFNAYVDRFNQENAVAIEAGSVEPLSHSSTEFIFKASGVQHRHVVEKAGILDVERMRPKIRRRGNDEVSLLAEIGVTAAREALETAGRDASEVDAVLVACSNLQRAYPAIAIEIQNVLGAGGFAFDMNVACSSATFGVKTARDMIRSGDARSVLVVSPEICSGHLNFRDRDSHFIFGDVATAVLVEDAEASRSSNNFEVLGAKLVTSFSNNIRNNFGFLNRAESDTPMEAWDRDRLFVQEGRKVFKDVVPMVSKLIVEHLGELDITPDMLQRMWLHQANINMNDLIGRKVLGREPTPEEQPNILFEYANTSSAGSIIAFHQHQAGLSAGDIGVICSFGAGYSAGSVVVRKQ